MADFAEAGGTREAPPGSAAQHLGSYALEVCLPPAYVLHTACSTLPIVQYCSRVHMSRREGMPFQGSGLWTIGLSDTSP